MAKIIPWSTWGGQRSGETYNETLRGSEKIIWREVKQNGRNDFCHLKHYKSWNPTTVAAPPWLSVLEGEEVPECGTEGEVHMSALLWNAGLVKEGGSLSLLLEVFGRKDCSSGSSVCWQMQEPTWEGRGSWVSCFSLQPLVPLHVSYCTAFLLAPNLEALPNASVMMLYCSDL